MLGKADCPSDIPEIEKFYIGFLVYTLKNVLESVPGPILNTARNASIFSRFRWVFQNHLQQKGLPNGDD